MAKPKHESDFKLTKDTPNIALVGELLGVCYDDVWEN